jgi:hypothetical protein
MGEMPKPQVFSREQSFPIVVPELGPVAQDVMEHFKDKGFEVAGAPLASGAWEISIHKGGWVKVALGTKLALNVTIRPEHDSTHVRAGAGVFGSSLVPVAIAWYVTWPALLTRAWGLIRQSRLDDQAIALVESSLKKHGERGTQPAAQSQQAHRGNTPAGQPQDARFCTSCHQQLTTEAAFCPACGTPIS